MLPLWIFYKWIIGYNKSKESKHSEASLMLISTEQVANNKYLLFSSSTYYNSDIPKFKILS